MSRTFRDIGRVYWLKGLKGHKKEVNIYLNQSRRYWRDYSYYQEDRIRKKNKDLDRDLKNQLENL